MTTGVHPARPWAWPTLAAGVAVLVHAAQADAPQDARGLARAGAETALALGLLAVGFAARAPRPLAGTLRLGPTRPPASALETASWVLGLLALSFALDAWIAASGARAHSRLGEIEALLGDLPLGALPAALLGIAIAPAVAEEVLFRGLVLGALLRRAPAWAAILGAAAIFGLAHADPVHGAAAGVLGAYLGVVAWATGSVRPGILAHALNNAVALAGAAWGRDGALPPAVTAGLGAGLAAGLVAAGVTLARRIRAPRTDATA